MCNCGNKRQGLTENKPETIQKSHPAINSFNRFNGKAVSTYSKFKYSGSHSLIIKSLSGNEIYKFSPINRLVTVKAGDAEMMRRFSELIEL